MPFCERGVLLQQCIVKFFRNQDEGHVEFVRKFLFVVQAAVRRDKMPHQKKNKIAHKKSNQTSVICQQKSPQLEP